jgi:hypothetical protein
VAGWYELTFDAAKVADFEDDMSLQVYAGKYYYADDRPQPQRLLGVVSLGNKELESHTIRAFLHPVKAFRCTVFLGTIFVTRIQRRESTSSN